jgi:hypoxanthine phosphoribosyltransferase
LTVKLPLAVVRKSGETGVHPTAEEPVATPAHVNNNVLEGVRVLVVDDEPDARDLLSALLRRSRR